MKKPRTKIIAVASGKGGTGKTTLSTHLALHSSRLYKTILADLDVEAPDALGLFKVAKPLGKPAAVHVAVPKFNEDRCTGCRLCAQSCRFGAIFAIGTTVTINEQLCKGCGRCVAACPAAALAEEAVEVGTTSLYRNGSLDLIEGRLKIGDIRSTAVIEAAKQRALEYASEIQIRDCPPGVSCPATHAVSGADYVVLVAEPTEFSLHDLKAAIELVQGNGIPAGVVVNKDGFGDADIDGFCEHNSMPVIGRIAFNKDRAVSGAAGMLWEEDTSFMEEIAKIFKTAEASISRSAGGQS